MLLYNKYYHAILAIVTLHGTEAIILLQLEMKRESAHKKPPRVVVPCLCELASRAYVRSSIFDKATVLAQSPDIRSLIQRTMKSKRQIKTFNEVKVWYKHRFDSNLVYHAQYDDDRKFHGFRRAWYPNGSLRMESWYIHGILEGNAFHYYISGDVACHTYWQAGVQKHRCGYPQ